MDEQIVEFMNAIIDEFGIVVTDAQDFSNKLIACLSRANLTLTYFSEDDNGEKRD